MTAAMNLLCRVVRRRLWRGEALEDILRDYPKLTEDQRAQVRAEIQISD